MTDSELATLKDNIEAIETAIRAFTAGDRVSEVRFGDRTIKYSEITLPELNAERARLMSQVPKAAGRVRQMKYVGL
ncbi:MAG: hypothetical protein HGB02_08670 [Chlorobiaceae bacterium]|nr:hypothetical protein [Chlorobiaceae bacterium]